MPLSLMSTSGWFFSLLSSTSFFSDLDMFCSKGQQSTWAKARVWRVGAGGGGKGRGQGLQGCLGERGHHRGVLSGKARTPRTHHRGQQLAAVRGSLQGKLGWREMHSVSQNQVRRGGTHPVPAIGAGAHQSWPTPRPSRPDTSQIRRTVSQMRLRARLCPQKNVDPEAGQSYTILGSEPPPHAERRPFSLGLKLGLDAARCLRFRFCTCAVGRLKEQALWAEAGKFRVECWKKDRCKEWRVACFEGLGMSPGKSRSQLFSLYCVFHCGSPSKCVCGGGGAVNVLP